MLALGICLCVYEISVQKLLTCFESHLSISIILKKLMALLMNL